MGEDTLLVERVRRAVGRHGVRGALTQAGKRVAHLAVVRESHVWYELDLAAERPSLKLAPELALRRGAEVDAVLLDELPTIPAVEGRKRMRAGNDLWLVVEHERPLFSCWLFRSATPVLAARGGWLDLPSDTVCLEDSVTAAAARGRGVAPAAWSEIADAVRVQGVARIITKVATDNAPSRRAVVKSGFQPLTVMRFRRVGWRSGVWLEAIASPPTRPFVTRLAESLEVAAPLPG